MPNLIDVTYAQTGKSTTTNEMGMREMQERAYSARDAQYLLLKAPPASGKSRALMFIALDKLHKQGIKKAIVAVPEKSIGGSFSDTALTKHGFFADWHVNPEYNLCTAGGDASKTKAFLRFLNSDERVLICTHATLRYAFNGLEEEKLNDTLIAIDEFHHVSADGENRLGELLRSVMQKSNAHIVAMTGSYFRGDSKPVLMPDDEAKFTKVVFNYYEQLNGYTHLKSLGIGYHFYQGKYTTAINEILDTDKKTILHIPSPNSGESTKDKYQEVDTILDQIGDVDHQDQETGIIYLRRNTDGKMLKIANLVQENGRERVQEYLRNIKSADDMDVIIALGMAMEGFDWPYCEHALTVGYRASLTQVIQIIGRCTRDSENKTHAQFTNLIAQPDAEDNQVTFAVNNMLKAITCSLLMEQVLAPNFKFKTKLSDEDKAQAGEMKIRGFKEPSSNRVKQIVEDDLEDLKVNILQDSDIKKTMTIDFDPEIINKVMIPKIIRIKYPDLNDEEIEEVRQHVVVDSVVKSASIEQSGDKRFIRTANKFINIDDLEIDLIDKINPFQQAYEILSKSVNAKVFKVIQEAIEATRIQMSPEEAFELWPKIKAFVKNSGGVEPNISAIDLRERRLAEALIYIKEQRRKQGM
ncbi:MAG: ATP-dependent helicase [Proteobacteria bacterium]|nr:ATP-dependent helicase [Pseudomonadota bacterium]MDA1056362.1 ATP-dependent helicase [Pseudomonadota bacterium]